MLRIFQDYIHLKHAKQMHGDTQNHDAYMHITHTLDPYA